MKNQMTIQRKFNIARILFSILMVLAIIFKLLDTEIGNRIDLLTIGLLVAAFAPWFSKHISKISIPGLIEAEIHKLQDEIETTNLKVQSINNTVLNTQDELILINKNQSFEEKGIEEIENKLREIGIRYIETRNSLPSGNQRTRKMDGLFREMVDVSKNNNSWKKYVEWLHSDRPELHLPAIAYLFTHPELSNVKILTDIIERTRHPFVQYWALRVLQRLIDLGGEFSLNDINKLRSINSSLSNATDRSTILSSIISKIDNRIRRD